MKKTYDWKITAKKFFWIGLEVLVAGLLVYATEHPAWLGIVPLIESLKNWLKHKND